MYVSAHILCGTLEWMLPTQDLLDNQQYQGGQILTLWFVFTVSLLFRRVHISVLRQTLH